MKLLHIDSSILGDNSASRKLTAEVAQAWKASAAGVEVAYHDLAKDALGHFSAASLDPNGAEAGLNAAALEEFLSADALVIGAPMYNFTIPTQLKAWIDRICVAGKTFRYTEAGPQGLCAGKQVVIVATSGGIHTGQATGAAHVDYLKLLLGFIGITDIRVVTAEGLAYGEDARTKAMGDAEQAIKGQFAG